MALLDALGQMVFLTLLILLPGTFFLFGGRMRYRPRRYGLEDYGYYEITRWPRIPHLLYLAWLLELMLTIYWGS